MRKTKKRPTGRFFLWIMSKILLKLDHEADVWTFAFHLLFLGICLVLNIDAPILSFSDAFSFPRQG